MVLQHNLGEDHGWDAFLAANARKSELRFHNGPFQQVHQRLLVVSHRVSNMSIVVAAFSMTPASRIPRNLASAASACGLVRHL
jgi:hypothetical protein